MRRRAIRVVIVSVLFLAGGRRAPGAPPGRGAPGEPAGDRPAGTIAFSSLAPRGWDLYLIEVESRRTRRLTDHPALDFNAASPPRATASPSSRSATATRSSTPSATDGSEPAAADRRLRAGRPPRLVARRPPDRLLQHAPARRTTPAGPGMRSTSSRPTARRPGGLDPAGHGRLLAGLVAEGDLIAVASGSGEAGGTDLLVMAPDGSGRRGSSTTAAGPPSRPTAARCSSTASDEGKWGIWRVGLDGSGLERITPAGRRRLHALGLGRRRSWLVAAVAGTATGRSPDRPRQPRR